MADEPAVVDTELPGSNTGFAFSPEAFQEMENLVKEKAPDVFNPNFTEEKEKEKAEGTTETTAEGTETEEQKTERERVEAEEAEKQRKAQESETPEQKAERERLAAEEQKKKDDAAKATPEGRRKKLEEFEKDLDPHTGKKTRKVIDQFKAEALAAETEAETARTALAEAQKKLLEAEEKAKGLKAPKAMEDELAQLREKVRELDITQDPAIKAKYDTRISSNENAILDIMKANGLGTKLDAKGVKIGDSPEDIEAVKKGGFTLGALDKFVKALEKAGNPDDAEKIRELVRENLRTAREKEAEISQWKGDYEGRVAARTRDQQGQQEKAATASAQIRQQSLDNDVADLTKHFPFMKEPEAPKAGDSADVIKAKNAALAEYKTAYGIVETAVKAMNPEGAKPEEIPNVIGRMQANAILGVIAKTVMVPRILKDLTARDARIKELETTVAKYKTGGQAARSHSAAVSAPANGNKTTYSPATDTKDALADFAKRQGIDTAS